MLSGDDTLVMSEDEAQNGNKAPSLLVDDGDEINLTCDSDIRSKLRLDTSSVESPFSSTEQHSGISGIRSSTSPSTKSPVRSPEVPFILTIKLTDFEKKGDGINAYIVYKIITISENVPGMSDRTYEVWRRFSDFLGLHDKLIEKYLSKGVVVPAAPEKSIAAMTKTKTTSDPALSRDVTLRRARQLERFLRRIVEHPRMRADCDVRDFLTMETDLPRAVQTAALSSAGMKRMFRSVGEVRLFTIINYRNNIKYYQVFSKMAFHMEEGDRWFEQTQSHIDELDESLRRLLHLAEGLTTTRKELAHAQESMSKVCMLLFYYNEHLYMLHRLENHKKIMLFFGLFSGLSMLASCEESTALARVLSHLTETEENAATLWAKQAEMDAIKFTESINEYVGLIGSLKDVFGERVRVWQSWQSAQQSLAKKREQKARLELSGKNDRASALKDEMDEAVLKMDGLETEFGDLSKLIREEVGRFEVQRRHDMRQMLIQYMESLIETHTEFQLFVFFINLNIMLNWFQMLKVWEKFEPETHSIIV
uniref:PX domain-containing protein n=1 Tax=Heterorhabditis bacteriophora TaxID=37862 RepID=A0A1I7XGY5_HETBA